MKLAEIVERAFIESDRKIEDALVIVNDALGLGSGFKVTGPLERLFELPDSVLNFRPIGQRALLELGRGEHGGGGKALTHQLHFTQSELGSFLDAGGNGEQE